MLARALLSLLLLVGLIGSAVTADEAPKLDDPTARASYSLGYQMGRDLERQGVSLRPKAALGGLRDGQSGREPRISDEEMASLLQKLKRRIVQKKVTTRREQSEALRHQGAEFLEQNQANPGVQTTGSGLQYKILENGSGERPGPSDKVRAHYRGTTIDGKEFVNTRKQNEPRTFALDGIMKGWSEGIQLMQEGAVYELYIPYTLAYNARGPLAYQTLIFEIELLEVNPESGDASGGVQ